MSIWDFQGTVMETECGLDGVVCPKPRRIGASVRPLLRLNSDRMVETPVMADRELVDIIRMKVASSPPFFDGSPPSRSSNPIIQDEQFVSHDVVKSGRGCNPVSFRPKPATIRVEGFNCCGDCRVSAVA